LLKKDKNNHQNNMKSLKKKPADTLEAFLARVEEYNSSLAQLQDNVGELRLVQAKVLSEPSVSERQKHLTRQQNLVKENKGIGAAMQKQIKEEKVKIDKVAKSQDGGSEVTIRKTQMEACMKRFLNIWTEYNNSQLEFRDSNKKALIRQLKIVDPTSNISDEEIEEKLENGDLTVLSSIIKESDQAKEDLKRLEGRHLEMIKLERGIVEVNDMFLDLAHLVESQGETVGRIEDQVGEAAGHVEQGRDQLCQVPLGARGGW
jgi:t-SNARE complex subunit (syntaxin)